MSSQARANADRQRAIAIMAAELSRRPDILEMVATSCIDTLIEYEVEERHGPTLGSA